SELIAALAPSGAGDETSVYVCEWQLGCSAADWIPVGPPASFVGVAGSVVALLTSPEGEIQVFDLDEPGYPELIEQASGEAWKAEEFVLGQRLVAFRTAEAEQGEDLNGDGDPEDAVLQVLDLDPGSPRLFNTEQAVTPCPLEACDPRVPYRVAGDTVTFITAEVEQGRDLNGDDDVADFVKQVFNVREAAEAPVSGFATAALASEGAAEYVEAIASASKGICSDSGAACYRNEDCGSHARCFLPPGTCVLPTSTSCDPENPVCDEGYSCLVTDSGTPVCHE
ncbi:unnamed protein product, partial [marine sediment metagenome]